MIFLTDTRGISTPSYEKNTKEVRLCTTEYGFGP